MKNNFTLKIFIILITLLGINVTSLLAVGEELIRNGSFENFDVKVDRKRWFLVNHHDWTSASGTGEIWNYRLGRAATRGYYKAELDVGRRSIDSITQTVSTDEGTTYIFKLDAYARSAGTSDFELLIDGEVVLSVSPTNNWGTYGVEFVANGGEQTFSIRELASQDNGLGAIIDNISVMDHDGLSLEEIKTREIYKYNILQPEGLSQILNIIDDDRYVNQTVSPENILKAKEAAMQMNEYFRDAIKTEGLTNDNIITPSDFLNIYAYIRKHYAEQWTQLREDYHLVEGKSHTVAMNTNAIKNVWGQIYNLGFPKIKHRRRTYISTYTNQRGAKFDQVGYILRTVLNKNDAKSEDLKNPEYKETQGTSGSSLDRVVKCIYNDVGLLRNVSTEDIRVASNSANEMNKLIIEAIKMTDSAENSFISIDDIRNIVTYLHTNYSAQWIELHGDDEEDEETGYHRIQNDGSFHEMYNQNGFDNIADGIYHLGFYPNYRRSRLRNEDGQNNASFSSVSYWLNIALQKDLKEGTLKN